MMTHLDLTMSLSLCAWIESHILGVEFEHRSLALHKPWRYMWPNKDYIIDFVANNIHSSAMVFN